MKTVFLFFLIFLNAPAPKHPIVDRSEAKKAFELLNRVRTNPKLFHKDFPFLKDYDKRHALRWNDTLALAAEAKAWDMATKNYAGHVDHSGFGMNYYINKAGYQLKPSWLKDPAENYFESINAGMPSGQEAIKSLLIDADVPSLGHRRHLLGIDSFYRSLYDIGIGFVRGDSANTYRTYTCVLIAKHE